MVSHPDVSVIEGLLPAAHRRAVEKGADVAALSDVARVIERRLREIEVQLRSYEELARERDRLRRALHELRRDDGARPRRAAATPSAAGRSARRRVAGAVRAAEPTSRRSPAT